MPSGQQLLHRASDQHRKIAENEARVLPENLDLAREREIRADQDLIAGHKSGGQALVVRIANTNDLDVLVAVLGASDFEQSKVPSPVMSQAVRFTDLGQSVSRQS